MLTVSLDCPFLNTRIGGVMLSVLASSAVDRGFEARSDQIKDYKIVIYCFSGKPAVLIKERFDLKFTSCLSMVSGSLRVLRLLPPLKLVAMI
jgi:hypothetical protein